jgi:hypothetical protein
MADKEKIKVILVKIQESFETVEKFTNYLEELKEHDIVDENLYNKLNSAIDCIKRSEASLGTVGKGLKGSVLYRIMDLAGVINKNLSYLESLLTVIENEKNRADIMAKGNKIREVEKTTLSLIIEEEAIANNS